MSKFKKCASTGFKILMAAAATANLLSLGRDLHSIYHMLDEAEDEALAAAGPDGDIKTPAADPMNYNGRPDYDEDMLPTVAAADALQITKFAETTKNPELYIQSLVGALSKQ